MNHRCLGPGAEALALAVALITVAGCGGAGNERPGGTGTAAEQGVGRTSAPPRGLPGDPSAAVHAAGLRMLGAEGTALHIHAHLDIVVDGTPVAVPAGIGIDEQARQISPLHTHDPTGIIHMESPEQATFTLGQLFTEWRVRLAKPCLGGLCDGGGKTLRVFVHGRPYTGDPATLPLAAHQEIELVYGPAGRAVHPIPPNDFPQGL